MKDNLFICSINEKYILQILRRTAFTGSVVGRRGLNNSLFDGYRGIMKNVYFPRRNYGFFNLIFFIGPRAVFDKIILPCYDPAIIPKSFFSLEWFCLLFSRSTVFVSPEGETRRFNRGELIALILSQLYRSISRIYLFNLLFIRVLLILKIPYSLWAVGRAFFPGGWGISNREFWAFSKNDARFRSWYNKITGDYAVRGRFGYAWDDGLGIVLGPRIYNNTATYKLLDRLGTRNMMALGYTLMISGVVFMAVQVFSPLTAAIAGILLAGAPLVISLYTHNGKPEIFWHGFIPIWIYLIFTLPGGLEQGVLTGSIWSFLAFVNLSVSVICGLMLAPVILFLSLDSGNFLVLLAAVLPGAIKIGLRFSCMIRYRFFSRLVKEQSRLSIDGWNFSKRELQWLIPYSCSIALSSFHARLYAGGALLLIFSVLVYWVNGRNGRIVKLNDLINMNSILGCTGLGFSLAAGSPWGLAAILFMYFSSPRACDFPKPSKGNLTVSRDYPALKPMAFPFPEGLKHFFDQIPGDSRIAMESDGDPRSASKFLRFWQWTEEFLPARGIELANEMYTMFAEPGLMTGYLNRLKPGSTTPAEITNICQPLGIAYIVGFSPAMECLLREAGFTETARVNLKDLPGFIDLIDVPPVEFKLFKAPSYTSVIEPEVSWKRRGNELSWEAVGGREYVIRYRYYPDFEAFREQERLTVEKMRPFPDIPLTFMRVKSPVDGPVTLRFRGRRL